MLVLTELLISNFTWTGNMISFWPIEESKDGVGRDQFSIGSFHLILLFSSKFFSYAPGLPDGPKPRSFWTYWGLWAVGELQFLTPWWLWWRRVEGIQEFKSTLEQLRNFCVFNISNAQNFWSCVELIGFLFVDFSSYRHLVFNFLLSAKSVNTYPVFKLPTYYWHLLGCCQISSWFTL